MNTFVNNKKGSLLILAVWTLMFLTILATTIGLRVRSRMGVLSRIEKRNQHHYAAEAGIKQAIAAIRFDEKRRPHGLEAAAKEYRYNNQELFGSIAVGEGATEISYPNPYDPQERLYGVVDEESKININTSDRITLARLIQHLTGQDEEHVKSVVEAIINWREIGNSELEGFASDEYYSNLSFPYPSKNAPYEAYEELLLIRDVDEKLYRQIKPFITIYGDGQVNINTASKEVLMAIGLEDEIADKVLRVRRGFDERDNTEDDYIFRNVFDVTKNIQDVIELEKEEIIAIDFLNAAGKIKAVSNYYLIESIAHQEGSAAPLLISCVYDASNNVIEYWKEKF